MKRNIKERLKKIVGADNFSDSQEDCLSYSYDGTGREYLPEAVLFPGSAAEVSLVMELASRERIPVVPRGAGSGMTGGALPICGGLVLPMSRLNRILEIDRENQLAVVEPGVITADLQNAVKGKNLFYPPDPASMKFCTIGGNAAECAGGPSAVKYGVTRDYVRGLQVVLADGRILNTGVRTAKGVVGYDLTRVFVGSEGTLGIITKLILKLIALPESKTTHMVLLDSMGKAAELVTEVLQFHLPCTLEYMDKTALEIVSDKIPFLLPDETRALLLIELDGSTDSVRSESEKLLAFLRNRPGVLQVKSAEAETQAANTFWHARRVLSPASFQLKPHKVNEDVVVPRSLIPELVSYVEHLSRDLDLVIFTFGHAGDGNIHVNIMLDKENKEEAARSEKAKKMLFEKVISMGGTLSGEHGIGLTKADYLSMEIDAVTLDVMKGLKKYFDPQNILNPGKIFP